MSDEKKDMGDKAEDAFDKAKEKAEETFDKAKEKAKEAGEKFEESTKDFREEAKKTAEEFTEGFKSASSGENKKILAGILAILLGWAGVHKFVLGYQKEGIIMLVLSVIGFVLTCIGIGVFLVWAVGLVALIEGVIYLTKSDEEFYNTYQAGRKPWF
ncbi:TM2 domain-containing membrane protein YozV [Robiginitalea myxolifaciens]|uniref:TM2 domain-containing membrane protein YozV n=1 Tax=Robiginitalea myxolifaciens TaxID=400055 RepID=A0A1I6FWW6_9FLAO|nr:NINE protein [Robiginitalea myxolifaciens]SFR34398.1 TM2 domain-containing membrane protein YozV [Robiginitalea myxolifaciens]